MAVVTCCSVFLTAPNINTEHVVKTEYGSWLGHLNSS